MGWTMLFSGRGVETKFSVVFMFLRFVFEGTELLSSPQRGEQSGSERNAPSLLFALAGGGAWSNAVTQFFVARNCAEQPEAREAGG
jgi:hypothetical protein